MDPKMRRSYGEGQQKGVRYPISTSGSPSRKSTVVKALQEAQEPLAGRARLVEG